jgi:hypothetical protein
LTRLERRARDKHSSLLRKSINYGRKKFYFTYTLSYQKYYNNELKSLFDASYLLFQDLRKEVL